MNAKFIEEKIEYTGKELRSHWVMERFGIEGDSIVSFVGSCNVRGEDLVDREDFLLGNTVAGEQMLHFIVEIFGIDLVAVVFAQRLLCMVVGEVLNSTGGPLLVRRQGDDLYAGAAKLSVSVATVSPVSGLIHLGLNITREGVPVKAASLEELGVDYRSLAHDVLLRFAGEIDACFSASRKVKPVM